jgi:hypothetical protein
LLPWSQTHNNATIVRGIPRRRAAPKAKKCGIDLTAGSYYTRDTI